MSIYYEKQLERLKIENDRLRMLIDKIITTAEKNNVDIRLEVEGRELQVTKANEDKMGCDYYPHMKIGG